MADMPGDGQTLIYNSPPRAVGLDNACTANAMQFAAHLALWVKERLYVKVMQQQLNSILGTTFSVGNHRVCVTGLGQQKGSGKRHGEVPCGSGLSVHPLPALYSQALSHTTDYSLLPTIWVGLLMEWSSFSWFGDWAEKVKKEVL